MIRYTTTVIILTLALLVGANFKADGQEGLTKAPSGLYYKIYKLSKDTTRPRIGDWVSLDMRYSARMNGKDSLLFDSRTQGKGEHVKMELPPSDFKGDLYEGLRMMSSGDSAVFNVRADSIFVRTFRAPACPPTIDSLAGVTFYIRLFAVESSGQLKKNEEEALKNYLADNKITVTPTASGIYIIRTQDGDGLKIDTGYSVKLNFTVSLIDGKQLFTSYNRPEPLKFEYGRRFDTPGFSEAIGTMKKGTKAKVIVPYTMGFGEKGRGAIVPAYATLVYQVEILDVMTKEDLEKEVAAEKQRREEQRIAAIQGEEGARSQYLKDHNITVQPRPSGLYYIEKVAGTGPQAEPGKKVKVHYTGTMLDGKKFDSSLDRNMPLEFDLGKGQVIQGWDEGISLMKVGGKALLIIPSGIGYGDREMGSIPAYSTLVFEVELLDVK
jgi:FKBP-type peptidyl-prolyl cis-trans isomerase